MEGKYKILREIGQGGMSRVYLAVHIHTGKYLAVKEVRKKDRHQEKLARKSLLSEWDILRQLSHPGCCRLVDVIPGEETLIVTEYISGESLEQRLMREGPADVRQVIRWGLALCDLLRYLHEREAPILYLDLKPANIMETAGGRLILIDFGNAAWTEGAGEESAGVGTPFFAPPEQERKGDVCDERTDLYALGATLFYLLTGKKDVGARLRGCDGTTRRLIRILRKCLEQDPKMRFSTAASLERELLKCSGRIKKDRKDAPAGAGGRRWQVILGGILVVLGLLGCGLLEGGREARLEETYRDVLIRRDYFEAARLMPCRDEAYYRAFVELITDGDQLTAPEEGILENLLETNLPVIEEKNPSLACLLTYQMAMAVYYVSEGEDAQTLKSASRWFDRLGDLCERYPLAEVPPGMYEGDELCAGSWLRKNSFEAKDRKRAGLLRQIAPLQYRILFGEKGTSPEEIRQYRKKLETLKGQLETQRGAGESENERWKE